MNEALFSKLARRILSAPDSLLAKVFNEKYEKDRGRRHCKSTLADSHVWKGAKSGLDTLKDKVCWAIGSASSARLGLDPWVPGSHLA